MPSPETDLYFFHIPKTAGSSLGHFLRSLYPKDERFDFIKPEQLIGMSREQINRHRYFHGHVGNLLYPFLDRDVPTVTFLRDPFEQSISRLRFMVHHNRGRRLFSFLLGCYLKGLQNHSGNGFSGSLDRLYPFTLHNEFQTRRLGVALDPTRLRPGPLLRFELALLARSRVRELGMDGVLEQAKRRLDSMAVVGVTERFDESLGLVCDFLKVPAPEKSPVERVAPGRSVHSSYRDDPTVPKALARLVERHTFYDRQIYAYANALLDQRLAGQDRPMGSEARTGTHERAA